MAIVFISIVKFFDRREKTKAAATAANYNSDIEHEKQKLLEGPDRASMPVLSAASYSYRPVGKEALIAVQHGAVRMEMKSTGRYRSGGASVSIPIFKGVRYRVGSTTIHGEKAWQKTADGRLIVTDKAIVFEGGEKNERINWSQVADVELLIDGYRISKRSGPPRVYAVAKPSANFAAVLELMLARTG